MTKWVSGAELLRWFLTLCGTSLSIKVDERMSQSSLKLSHFLPVKVVWGHEVQKHQTRTGGVV